MIEPGRSATKRLLERTTPDAIFCANDLLAIGALSALREAGLDVPGDVALVGVDNTTLAEVTWPTLTSVDLGSAERARLAAELLLERIEGLADEPRMRRRRAAPRRPRLLGSGSREHASPRSASRSSRAAAAAAPAPASPAGRRCCC